MTECVFQMSTLTICIAITLQHCFCT